MRYVYISLGFLLLFQHPTFAQETEIVLNNPSFEEIPHKGGLTDIGISGWYDCGRMMFPGETPPDVHPLDFWEVDKSPSEGNTYLGLVIRDNDSWESISQRMKTMLEPDKCYEFSIDLSRSEYYISKSKMTMKEENYTEPAVLRIWGGTGVCGQQELLGESATVSNNDWKNYSFRIEPGRNLNFITLEAFYKVPVLFPYNGHLLIDNASAIKEIPCQEEQIVVSEDAEKPVPTKKTTTGPKKVEPTQPTETAVVEQAAISSEKPASDKKLLEELYGRPLRVGQIIRVHSIYFAADSTNLQDESFEALEEIYQFLKENRNVIIEIGGHTNTVPSPKICDRLSSERAKEVALALQRKGISANRVAYKGYGKRKPIVWNDKYDMEARKRNQRVEIKILSL